MRGFQVLLIVAILHASMVCAREQPPAQVVVSKIVSEEVAQNQAFIGTLYYERISHVSSDVSGLVTRVHVRTGDEVNNGAPLVHIDTEILEKEIVFHKNQIQLADLNIRHTKITLQRMDALFKKDSLSERDYDDARFAHEEAVLRKIAASTTLDKLLIQKRKSVIRAPFDGIILEKNVDSGDWVQQGKLLVDIGSMNDLFVKVPVAETMLKFISPGQSVPVIINAYGKEMTGTIDNLSPKADPKTKNIFLKIRIPVLTKVAQNMSATVFVPTGKGQTLFMIPRDALIRFQGKEFVYTIKEQKALRLGVNVVTYQGNRVGADNRHFKVGMPIVVEGNERLRPGQSVVVIKAK